MPRDFPGAFASLLLEWRGNFFFPRGGSMGELLLSRRELDLQRVLLPAAARLATSGEPGSVAPCWIGHSGPAFLFFYFPLGTICWGRLRCAGFLITAQLDCGAGAP